MIYSITFDLKSARSAAEEPGRMVIWAKSEATPPFDRLEKLVRRLHGDEADLRTIHVVKGGEEWDEKEIQKGTALFDLDQE